MSTIVETIECFPVEIKLGDTSLGTPGASHETCSGGHRVAGLLGGWVCPCRCHHKKEMK
jgi:hypothetical protein